MLLIIRLHIPAGRFVRKRRVWPRATSLSMSELTATEALDPRKGLERMDGILDQG